MLSCLVVGGCSGSGAGGPGEEGKVIPLGGFWEPYLLYLLASPHSQLYVEVDAVEGCVPDEAALEKLRDFLTAYCDKPGGVEVVRSNVIPVEAARGIASTALARRYLNGPPESSGGAGAAFLYVLCYDGGLSNTPDAKPCVYPLPYPAAMFLNIPYVAKAPADVRDEMPVHEAGHLLGLASRTTHAANVHCLDKNCLMYPNLIVHVHLLSVLLFRNSYEFNQRQLCAECVSELARSKRRVAGNLRFVGPVLVRSEAGYHVLSLPMRVKLIVGELTEQDCRDFAAASRAEAPSLGGKDDDCRFEGCGKEEVVREPGKLQEILGRAKCDPYSVVRDIAVRMEVKVQAEKVGEIGLGGRNDQSPGMANDE